VKNLKIVTKDNFSRDLFTEQVIAENVNEHIGKQLVKEWNNKYWDEYCQWYLELVDDDYELYDGYADLA
jgi:hypothetical protein